MKTTLSLVFMALLTFAIISCKKNQDEPQPADSIEISSMTTDKSVVRVGESANITIIAKGSSLSYIWSSSSGTVLPEQTDNSKAQYIPCSSCVGAGKTTITCKVSDGSTSKQQSIEITVR